MVFFFFCLVVLGLNVTLTVNFFKKMFNMHIYIQSYGYGGVFTGPKRTGALVVQDRGATSSYQPNDAKVSGGTRYYTESYYWASGGSGENSWEEKRTLGLRDNNNLIKDFHISGFYGWFDMPYGDVDIRHT